MPGAAESAGGGDTATRRRAWQAAPASAITSTEAASGILGVRFMVSNDLSLSAVGARGRRLRHRVMRQIRARRLGRRAQHAEGDGHGDADGNAGASQGQPGSSRFCVPHRRRLSPEERSTDSRMRRGPIATACTKASTSTTPTTARASRVGRKSSPPRPAASFARTWSYVDLTKETVEALSQQSQHRGLARSVSRPPGLDRSRRGRRHALLPPERHRAGIGDGHDGRRPGS